MVPYIRARKNTRATINMKQTLIRKAQTLTTKFYKLNAEDRKLEWDNFKQNLFKIHKLLEHIETGETEIDFTQKTQS